MYKRTLDKTSFLARTGSHSTKPPRHESATPDEERVLAQVENMDLQEVEDFRERQLKRLAALNDTLNDRRTSRPPMLGREIMRIQLTLTLANRHIKSLRRTAVTQAQNAQWRLAASFALSLPDAAKLDSYYSAVRRFTEAHGYPPGQKQQLEEFMLKEQLLAA